MDLNNTQIIKETKTPVFVKLIEDGDHLIENINDKLRFFKMKLNALSRIEENETESLNYVNDENGESQDTLEEALISQKNKLCKIYNELEILKNHLYKLL